MQRLHVFIAFILAVLLMSGAYYAVWQYSMMQNINGLSEYLNSSLPGKVKYNHAATKFHPFYPQVVLKNASIAIADPKTGATAVASFGDVTLNVKPFSSKGIKINVPRKITVVTTYKGRSYDYRILLLEPSFEVKNREGDFTSLMTIDGMVVKERQNGYFSNVIKTGYSYISRNSLEEEWSFITNDLDLSAVSTFKKSPVLKAASFMWTPHLEQEFPLGYVLAAMGSKDKVVFDTMVMEVMKLLTPEGKLTFSEARVAYNDIWYSYNGEIEIDKNFKIKGHGSLSSNKFADMLSGIKTIMGGFPIALSNMMESIGAKENKTQSIGIGAEKGILNINGAPVGVMPNVPELMHLHGRGLR